MGLESKAGLQLAAGMYPPPSPQPPSSSWNGHIPNGTSANANAPPAVPGPATAVNDVEVYALVHWGLEDQSYERAVHRARAARQVHRYIIIDGCLLLVLSVSCLQLSIQERKHSDPGPDSVTVDTLTFITAPSALVDLELDNDAPAPIVFEVEVEVNDNSDEIKGNTSATTKHEQVAVEILGSIWARHAKNCDKADNNGEPAPPVLDLALEVESVNTLTSPSGRHLPQPENVSAAEDDMLTAPQLSLEVENAIKITERRKDSDEEATTAMGLDASMCEKEIGGEGTSGSIWESVADDVNGETVKTTMVTEAIDDTAMSAIDASCVLDADSTAGLDSGSAAGPASVPGADSDAVTTNAGFSEVIDHNANILTLGVSQRLPKLNLSQRPSRSGRARPRVDLLPEFKGLKPPKRTNTVASNSRIVTTTRTPSTVTITATMPAVAPATALAPAPAPVFAPGGTSGQRRALRRTDERRALEVEDAQTAGLPTISTNDTAR
ncbi:hypothetical protein FIBSPDRAFT_1000945 [Athelia psychrophila]|uniref:Uncharacterized protein n=1 Tax=Athelia psychrophila TaxID=1759441 RepID=A0A166QME7_9AGAM|nr:hypothetical protein FIBSPDRAFT_1000945 [Fibularhizoctonia sp. CBS 109695]